MLLLDDDEDDEVEEEVKGADVVVEEEREVEEQEEDADVTAVLTDPPLLGATAETPLLLVLPLLAWRLNHARRDLTRLIVAFLDERAKEFGLVKLRRSEK